MSSGSSGSGGDPAGRLYTLEEMDRYVLPRTADIRLTTEDVVLLLLQADPRPVVGKDALASQAFLAVTGPLARSGVEPIAFRRGRDSSPRSAHVELALDHLAFTKNVAVSGRGKRGGPAITITAKGRSRIAEKHGRLPAAVRSALARKRAEWGGEAPECGMKDATYVHNRELLERLPVPGVLGGRGRRKGARRAGKGDTRGGGGTEPPAGTVAGSTIEECHAVACALAAGGDHEAAIRLFERAILLDPTHVASYRGKAESLAALGSSEDAAKFHGVADMLAPNRVIASVGSEDDDAATHGDAQTKGVPAGVPAALTDSSVQGGAPTGKKRRYPRILGFPSMVGALLGPPNEDKQVPVFTQFELYKAEQLAQDDGILAHNTINGLLSNLVYPLLLRAYEDRPVPKDFDLYAVQITMHSKEKLNNITINEDVKLAVACTLTRNGLKENDAVLVKDVKEIVSINELDRDPDAAAISLLRINGTWFGKFDVVYNRKIVHQKLKRALKFLNDSIRDDNSLESRYDLLWSGCELLGECMLLLHNMLKPRSSHKQIQKTLGQLLRLYNFSYIEEYNEIARMRTSLRYGPPHPDLSAEAEKKMAHLQDASMEFAAFAIGFLGGRQVSAGAAGDPT